jgi:hypothetical protein
MRPSLVNLMEEIVSRFTGNIKDFLLYAFVVEIKINVSYNQDY